MLKNIIFDMGGVLIRFDPVHFVNCASDNEADRAWLLENVFRTVGWCLQDWGTLDEAGFEALVQENTPEHLRETVHQLIHDWNRYTAPMQGMADLVRDCKEAGLKIVLLSNASSRLHEYWKDVPGHEVFDGIVVSADLKIVKPMPAIFEYTLNTYDLKADETLFVDDSVMNLSGAMQVGLHTFHFKGNANALREAIREYGVSV